MAKPTVTDRDIARLDEERRDADRQYNDGLTRVDCSLVQPEPLPDLPPSPPYRHHAELNSLWEIAPAGWTPHSGWRGRLASIVWRLVAPAFQRQQAFNAALVGHINQQVEHELQARSATAALVDAVRREFDALARFQSELIQFLQQVTPYVDTKDRHETGLLRRQLEERAIALAAGLNGVSDELLRRWESMVAREQRFGARVDLIAAAQEELRVTVAGYQRTSLVLKQELERFADGSQRGAAQTAVGAPAAAGGAAAAAPPSRPEVLGTQLDSARYVGFEDTFRGSTEDITARVSEYVPLFQGASDVLDIGCGRGEFLELLRASGVGARGIDINHAMVEMCRTRGLDVEEGDAVGYLESLPDASLGGVLAVQVVEHLQSDRLVRLLELAYHKLRPGSRIALETINPACWYAFFASYIRDITHVHPIHPDTLRYLLLASGFQRVEIRYRQPYPEHDKLQPVPMQPLAGVAAALGDAAETFNANVTKLNGLLFTHLDYTAIGEKL